MAVLQAIPRESWKERRNETVIPVWVRVELCACQTRRYLYSLAVFGVCLTGDKRDAAQLFLGL